jgi:hypothetical protein
MFVRAESFENLAGSPGRLDRIVEALPSSESGEGIGPVQPGGGEAPSLGFRGVGRIGSFGDRLVERIEGAGEGSVVAESEEGKTPAGQEIRSAVPFAGVVSRKDRLDHLSEHVGEPVAATAVGEGEFLVIHS